MSNRVTMGQDDSMMLQRDTLPMQVLNKLMDWIMDGKLKMGEKLNTEELARQLGVSRMPIREALKSLEKMGLAESIPYVGVKLVSLEQEDVLQIYLMRQLLEPLAAGEACKKITEEQIHELEEIHKEYVPIVEADEIDAKKLYLQNRKFHFAIYSISEMDRVCAMIESLWDTLSFFKLIYGRDVIKNTNGAKNMIAEHQGYIDALKDRDAERLKKSLYDTLGVRIEGISKETDYYIL
ncbi:GntR family transcriptional regulator [Dorea longicatena]|uniref:GntR family transcriptional regulator n=1 Tax=Dorea longicatena TaxID=88431 RepID=UPI001FAE4B21|nr:GntR family transcriptional regulator [Dorea longicatena]